MKKMKTLRDIYVDELRDLYSAEKQIIKALPKMAKAAAAPELKQAFEEHLEQTRVQVERLEWLFERLGVRAAGHKCKAVAGLIEECQELMKMVAEPHVLDAALIAAAQKVEHFEMAAYGCVRTWATMLDDEDAAEVLQETLDEEGEADKLLSGIAELLVNVEAVEAD